MMILHRVRRHGRRIGSADRRSSTGPRAFPRPYCEIVTRAGGLGTPPTDTTTSCAPSGAFAGTVKLIWVTPESPGGMPTNKRSALTPPTVTVTGASGLGRSLRAVLVRGVLPV